MPSSRLAMLRARHTHTPSLQYALFPLLLLHTTSIAFPVLHAAMVA